MSVTDLAGLRRLGVPPHAASRLLSEAFCAMVFRGGFVHCDPHPGNVLVRRGGKGEGGKGEGGVQLVLLDHGLYRALPREFTLTYARLWQVRPWPRPPIPTPTLTLMYARPWQGLVLGDADLIREQAEAMGVGRYYPLLAAMLTARPWTDIMASDDPASLAERGTAEDKAQIAGYAAQYARQIGLVLDKVPRPMLLLFKTNDCLRHAERQLGGGAAGASSLLITLRYCLEAVPVSYTHLTLPTILLV